jgi:hypothetical protein
MTTLRYLIRLGRLYIIYNAKFETSVHIIYVGWQIDPELITLLKYVIYLSKPAFLVSWQAKFDPLFFVLAGVRSLQCQLLIA